MNGCFADLGYCASVRFALLQLTQTVVVTTERNTNRRKLTNRRKRT